jgi:hypothetical protein
VEGYPNVQTVKTVHEDFVKGFVDFEGEGRVRDEGNPFDESFGCECSFHCIVRFIMSICKARESEL